MAITHADIGVSQPAASTITMKVATLTLARNSTTQHQELITLADPDTTNALTRVVATTPPSTSFGIVVRQAMGGVYQSTASTMGSGSTASTCVSSAATVPYVAAFSVTSTVQGLLTCGFYVGSSLRWPFTLWSDGGKPEAAQAVSAPGWLFKGKADRPIDLHVSSTGSVTYGITYWVE